MKFFNLVSFLTAIILAHVYFSSRKKITEYFNNWPDSVEIFASRDINENIV